jgi:hypothetical protein
MQENRKEDDLDDFFAEIQQVEQEVQQNDESDTIPLTGERIPAEQQLALKPQVVNEVISRAAEIIKPSQLKDYYQPDYPLFTYEAVDPNFTASNDNSSTIYGEGEMPSFPSSSSSAAVAAAPAFFPRQVKKFVRKAADEVWVDNSLQEWPENDYRIFVGDLGKEVTTEMLGKTYSHYKSYAKAKVIRNKGDNKTKGFGFVSFLDPNDCIAAIREMNGKYLGTR